MKPSPLQPLLKQHASKIRKKIKCESWILLIVFDLIKKSAPVGNTPHSKRNSGIIKPLVDVDQLGNTAVIP